MRRAFEVVVIFILGLLLLMLLASGCDFSGQGRYVVYKASSPTPSKSYTVVETYSPPHTIYETHVVEEVYVCEPTYDPTPQFPYECVDYGIGVGSCCTYLYGDWDWTCEEEWCWWEDMCYWENTYSQCFYH